MCNTHLLLRMSGRPMAHLAQAMANDTTPMGKTILASHLRAPLWPISGAVMGKRGPRLGKGIPLSGNTGPSTRI